MRRHTNLPLRMGVLSINNQLAYRLVDDRYYLLSDSLVDCGCLQSAYKFCNQGLQKFPKDEGMKASREKLYDTLQRIAKSNGASWDESNININDYSDTASVRREIYPWNSYEPDRFSEGSMEYLNGRLAEIGPKLAIHVIELPLLKFAKDKAKSVSIRQLRENDSLIICKQ